MNRNLDLFSAIVGGNRIGLQDKVSVDTSKSKRKYHFTNASRVDVQGVEPEYRMIVQSALMDVLMVINDGLLHRYTDKQIDKDVEIRFSTLTKYLHSNGMKKARIKALIEGFKEGILFSNPR